MFSETNFSSNTGSYALVIEGSMVRLLTSQFWLSTLTKSLSSAIAFLNNLHLASLTKPCTSEDLLGAITVRLEKQAAFRQWCAIESQQVSELPSIDTAKPADPQSIFPACPKLSKVFHFIEANYHQPITLKDVAKAVRYSPAYLTDLVRHQTGTTVNHWIVCRMAQACSFSRRLTTQ